MSAEASLASCYRHGRLWQEDYTEAQAMWASQTTQLPCSNTCNWVEVNCSKIDELWLQTACDSLTMHRSALVDF